MTTTVVNHRDIRCSVPQISSLDELAKSIGMTAPQLKRILGKSAEPLKDWLGFKNESTKIAVIDCSIVAVYGFMQYLKQNFNKVVVSNITAAELNFLKEQKDQKNWSAAQALLDDIVSDTVQAFYIQDVKIERLWDDEQQVFDNDLSIISFCEKQKEKYVLVSADAGMVLRARNRGINTVFLDQINTADLTPINLTNFISKKIFSKDDLRGYNYELVIRNIEGNLINSYPYSIQEGDDVFLLTREKNRGRKVTVFKYIRVTSISNSSISGGIIKKIIFHDNEKVNLYNFAELKGFLENLICEFRNNNK